jgi:hypothetical protein
MTLFIALLFTKYLHEQNKEVEIGLVRMRVYEVSSSHLREIRADERTLILQHVGLGAST